jgi:hypothetical protein
VAIDYSLFAFPKGKPAVIERKASQRADKAAWRKTSKAVDTRDKDEDGAPTCFITGKRLQTSNTLNEWTFRDRAHLDARSTNPARKFDPKNVISVSRGVHNLIDSGALLLFNKRGQPARTVRTIDHVGWNPRMVSGQPPCSIRNGLAVIKLDKVKD